MFYGYQTFQSTINYYFFADLHQFFKTTIGLIYLFPCRWLCNPKIDTKTRNWAIEGLAYLTNDADVKDDFVEDEAALKAMFELAKVWRTQIQQIINPDPDAVKKHCLFLFSVQKQDHLIFSGLHPGKLHQLL